MTEVTQVSTYATLGLVGYPVHVETDMNKSLPTLEIIGLPDAAVKEAKERIRMSFKNSNISFPAQKIVVNLAPSDVRKVGTRFDLAIATAILLRIETPHPDAAACIAQTLFFGELGLDGSIKKITGLLPAVIDAYKQGHTQFVVPQDNLAELEYIPDITIYPLTNFGQLVDLVLTGVKLTAAPTKTIRPQDIQKHNLAVGFEDIRGHEVPKRALTIAAAGMHNILMVGPPGSGKTMLSKALLGILPPLTFDEMVDVSQLYSLVGALTPEQPFVTHRPFRVVHHTASKVAIVGGGKYMTPGEISLAHLGILFFDELAEFPREVLEVLRQPLEDKTITISRANGSVSYPADFMFVATMNPCRCGYYKDDQKQCTCSLHDIARYQGKISGPLLDRFDMILEIPRENIDTILDKKKSTSSTTIEMTVATARERQQHRYQDTPYSTNAQLTTKAIYKHILLSDESENFLKTAVKRFDLSPRVIHRIMKLARTIADVSESDDILVEHIAEALQYRAKTMFVGG